MKLLALDTSTEACSVAVWYDGEVVERHELGRQQSQRLLPMVQEVLADAGLALNQLDALAFGRGPGSFTGLRIGAGVAQGIAFGGDLPVLPVSSLVALAQGQAAARVLAALDARMGQVYWVRCVRQGGVMVAVGEERVSAPSDVTVPAGERWVGAGSGWDVYAPALQSRLGDRVTQWLPRVLPRARHVAELGAVALAAGTAVRAEQALPVYVRDEVTHKPSSAG
jgi:tRNA threonylcarbamoyladenosine biosynthesis protein TsaB